MKTVMLELPASLIEAMRNYRREHWSATHDTCAFDILRYQEAMNTLLREVVELHDRTLPAWSTPEDPIGA